MTPEKIEQVLNAFFGNKNAIAAPRTAASKAGVKAVEAELVFKAFEALPGVKISYTAGIPRKPVSCSISPAAVGVAGEHYRTSGGGCLDFYVNSKLVATTKDSGKDADAMRERVQAMAAELDIPFIPEFGRRKALVPALLKKYNEMAQTSGMQAQQ